MLENKTLTNYFHLHIYAHKIRYLYGQFMNELKVTKPKTTYLSVKTH